jgi:hypothetical protein
MTSTGSGGASRPVEPEATVSPSQPVPEVDTEIGWGRAILSGLAILLVGFGGAVIGANRILTKALGLRRTPREWLATGLFFVVLLALAWILRRLQDRKLI